MNKKHIMYIICVLFIVVTGMLFFLKNYNSKDEILLEDVMQESAIMATEDISVDGSETGDYKQDEDEEESTNRDNFGDEYIYVHICGAISKPGVYKLPSTARVVDIIKMAGGLTSKADGVAINQAKLLSDSEQIYIPLKGEKLTVDGDMSTSRCESKTDNKELTDSQGKVNINKASKSDLITLPGIGEAKADTIIQYRQKNGSFSKIEDIMNITGIKEGLFNKISEYITV